MDRASLETLARRWRRHRALRDGGLAVAAGSATSGLLLPLHAPAAAALGIAAAIGTWTALRRRSPSITANTVAEHLNRQCPTLEESASLWLRDPQGLELVERLQLQRLNRAWNQLPCPRPGAPDPRRLFPALLAVVLSTAFLIGMEITTARPDAQPAASVSSADYPTQETTPIVSSAMEVRPPSYLGRPSRRIEGLSAEIEEGSEVRWSFTTTPEVTALELSSHGTNVALLANPLGENQFEIRHKPTDTFVYQVAVRIHHGSNVISPSLHALQIRRDAPPRVTWRSPSVARTTFLPTADLSPLPIEVHASDDHSVAEVRLRLTLAKGSGEGVRFREQSEILQALPGADSADSAYGWTLDLAAFGLEPGDELYLEVVATDSRRPMPNETRTEIRSVTVAGPSSAPTETAVLLSGLRRVPQYFRSQRQLILDTEQLLAERTTLPETQFRTRSENLGIDQKLLRLRYGQFLGEEFEPESAGAPKEAVAREWAAAVRNPSGQDADRTAAIGRAIETTHLHRPAPDPLRPPRTVQEMFAGLAHDHDNPEAATFFDERLKASLRAVLAAMWEAERHLRTAQPESALPAEHHALELLKAIQQADRLSVGRVGSELPPLRLKERRLRGELESIPTSAPGTSTPPRDIPEAAALRSAVAHLAGTSPHPIPEDIAKLVEDRLWRAAQTQPERYLPALETWRSRTLPLTPSALDALRHAVWSLLPATDVFPHRRQNFQPGLEQRYADALAEMSSATP